MHIDGLAQDCINPIADALHLVPIWYESFTFPPRHDDVINGSVFRVTGPLCGEFTGHRSQRPVSTAINDFEYVFKMAEELPRYIATFESYEVLTNLYLTFPLSWGPLKICVRSAGWLHNWIALFEKNKWQARVLRHQTKPCSKWRIEGLSPMGRYTMFKAHYPLVFELAMNQVVLHI